MRFVRTHGAAAFAALVLLASAGLASAAQFALSLTRIHLGASHPVETVTMRNPGATPLAFEVQVKRWTQGADGAWALVPDDGLVVHPLILRVAPGAEGRLRIGSLSPTVAKETAYRLELAELPDRARQKAGAVRMLARVSVPVFVQPAKATPTVALSVIGVDANGAHLVLRNTGTAYAAPGEATLRILDAAGKSLHESPVTTNYVLAGAQWPFDAKLSANACARAATIELRHDAAPPLVAKIDPGSRRCAP